MESIKNVIGALEEELQNEVNGVYILMRRATVENAVRALKSIDKPEEQPKSKTTRRTKKA